MLCIAAPHLGHYLQHGEGDGKRTIMRQLTTSQPSRPRKPAFDDSLEALCTVLATHEDLTDQT